MSEYGILSDGGGGNATDYDPFDFTTDSNEQKENNVAKPLEIQECTSYGLWATVAVYAGYWFYGNVLNK